MVGMPFDAHPEAVGTVLVMGALGLGLIRLLIVWVLQPANPPWPLLGITLLGITFAITRLVHYGTDDPQVALSMIRAQYGIGFVLPGLGMATIEAWSIGRVGRRCFAFLAAGTGFFFACLLTPWFVHTPMHVRLDAFGHEHLGAEPGVLVAIVLPLVVIATTHELARLLWGMRGALLRQRPGFLIGAVLFAAAGIHDSLLGSGVIRSVFVLEYVFVAFGILAANFELRRTALLQAEFRDQLIQKRSKLEEREASLQRTTARLERSNTRYRHLADATHEGVLLCAGQRILDANEAACRLLGGHSRMRIADLRSIELEAFVVDSDRLVFRRLLELEEGPIELGLRCTDGSQLPVSIKSIAPPEGSPGTRVLLIRDVSTERELQRRLATADRLAAVGTLAAGTAHEINNPLAFVIANVELLEESLAAIDVPAHIAADQRELLGDTKLGALRIRDVVRDLMSLARDRGGETAPVDVGETLRRCIAMASPQVKHRARVQMDFEEVGAVQANEGRLFQVFLNLIVNAAQAIPEGSVDKNVITIRVRSKDGCVEISITDTGSGMSESVKNRIFEPFFTTKEVGHGTGLGLSISHGIVTDLGGRIEVDSTIGIGTTFRVILPITQEKVLHSTSRKPIDTGSRLRVLIVDDEQAFARSLARMLEAHDVDVTYSGRTAFEKLTSGSYDVALCDVMMPDVTGIQLYERLREARHPIVDRFLFMTGGVSTRESEQFLEKLGTDRWVTKPIPMLELRRRITALGRSNHSAPSDHNDRGSSSS